MSESRGEICSAEVTSGEVEGGDFLRVKQGAVTKLISRQLDAKKLYLEVTNKCNLDCITCIRNSWQGEQGYMDVSLFDNLVRQIKELPQLTTVHFGGFGEPLSHPDIIQFIGKLKEQGLRVEMISNGFLLSEEISRALVDLKLDRLVISLDGSDEASFNEIRLGGEFHQVVENIKILNRVKQEAGRYKPDLGIEFVAMKRNYLKLPELLKLADSIGAYFVIVTNLLPYSED
ncbi:MAG: radical SAM protein, partial [Clostridia bacterium]|nr:radical SAM protein [Clostridia bacterium]